MFLQCVGILFQFLIWIMMVFLLLLRIIIAPFFIKTCSMQIQDGLYVMNLQKSNNSHVYNITTKKFKSNDLNSTYLWHCRLGHINEKRVSKLNQVGLLNSFDFESYDTCESCLLGKMTKDPFTGHSERANELLDLIHTYVCGPLSLDARGGYKYLITFTDYFSRYGYVYLMRHKS